jgi:hypothetical protein
MSRIRPYKDFLTPALHRRFTTAAVTLLGLCYADSILIGQWDSCELSIKARSTYALTFRKFCGHGFLLVELVYGLAFSLFVPFQSSFYELHNCILEYEQRSHHFRLSSSTLFGGRPYKQLSGIFFQHGCIARSTSFHPHMMQISDGLPRHDMAIAQG